MDNVGLLSKGNTGSVDPAIQEQFDMFMSSGISIIHDKKVSDSLIKQLRISKEPVDSIAQILLGVIRRIENSAESNGIKIDTSVKVSGANQLLGEIINLAETVGMPPLTDEQKYQAFSLAISLYINEAIKSGKMTKEQLMQMAEEAKQTPEGQKITQQMQQGGQPQQAVPPQATRPPMPQPSAQRPPRQPVQQPAMQRQPVAQQPVGPQIRRG